MDLEKLRKDPEVHVKKEYRVPIAFSESYINYMVYERNGQYFHTSDIPIDLFPRAIYFDEKSQKFVYQEEYNRYTGRFEKQENPFVNSFEREKEHDIENENKLEL